MFTLKWKFLKEKFAAMPSRKFRAELWNTLEGTLPPETRTERRMGVVRRTAIGFAIAVPMLFVGTGAYAYSSADVTEGTTLYPMKRGIEVIYLRFLSSPEDIAEFHLRMYERRLDEAERLLDTRSHVIETLNDAVEEDDRVNALEEFEEMRAEHRGEMLERLRKIQERYEMVRGRVQVDEPNEDPSLRTPSFMLRRMQH